MFFYIFLEDFFPPFPSFLFLKCSKPGRSIVVFKSFKTILFVIIIINEIVVITCCKLFLSFFAYTKCSKQMV